MPTWLAIPLWHGHMDRWMLLSSMTSTCGCFTSISFHQFLANNVQTLVSIDLVDFVFQYIFHLIFFLLFLKLSWEQMGNHELQLATCIQFNTWENNPNQDVPKTLGSINWLTQDNHILPKRISYFLPKDAITETPLTIGLPQNNKPILTKPQKHTNDNTKNEHEKQQQKKFKIQKIHSQP